MRRSRQQSGRGAVIRRAVSEHLHSMAAIALLAAVGVVTAGYVLIQQRFPNPFRDTYEVKVLLRAADGVAPGFGQPVTVSGVKVGTITADELQGDKALVTLEISRKELPRVYEDAQVRLQPITPLKDMEMALDPGSPSARPLPEGGTISASRSSSPVPLSDLLSTLDVDTREFLTALITGLGSGTRERAPDLRKLFAALGPTTSQVRAVATTLDARRTELARLVHNVSAVTKAASSDGRMSDVVAAGNTTLEAIRGQDADLRRSLRTFPVALATTRRALRTAAELSEELGPTSRALIPPLERLPSTLQNSMRPIAGQIDATLEDEFRPFVRRAVPLARELNPAVASLKALTPDISRVLQVANYVLNEFAYNPPGKDDEGMLYWFSWFAHNWNSVTSSADAHGSVNRVNIFVGCQQMTQLANLSPLYDLLLGGANRCKAGS